MPVVASVVKCKKCNFEIRSDWKYCPNCGDKIVCVGKYQVCKKGRELELKEGTSGIGEGCRSG